MRAYLFILSLLIISCGSDPDVSGGDWLIPPAEVFDGGPGKDGIPSVDDPKFESVSENTYLDPNDLVIGLVHNGVAKAYPHRILDWHEIVNDNIDDRYFALTYCPLTGTGISWNREINNNITTFGVSGKLYNTNLMPFDRGTDSYWSQMRLDCVSGDLIETTIETFPIIETTWATWSTKYPNSSVMTLETGFDRNYNSFPYGDYRTNHSNIIFPVSPLDSSLPAKERVLAVISNSDSKIYSIESFENEKVVMDNFAGSEILVLGSKSKNYLLAYVNNGLVNVQSVEGNGSIVAEDDNGNKISMDGEVIEGPLAGRQLEQVKSILGYYFSMAAFYPDATIYK